MNKKENLIRTIKRDNPQWVPYRYDGALAILASNYISVRPKKGGLDDWGVNWIYTNDEEGSYSDGKPLISIDDIDQLKIPDTNWEKVSNDMREQIAALADDVLPIAYNELFLFQRMQFLLGYEEFMYALIEEREKFDRLVELIFQYNKKLTVALLDSGVAGIRFTDDWGMQDRLFISPDDWRCFFKERYRVLYNMVKDRGGFVFQHSCGKVESILPDIVELGVDVLDPIQPSANNIFKLKQDFGRDISFMGGLDTQTWLSFGTPEEVYENTLKVIRVMADGGGYIAAPSHTISIPEDNRKAMVAAIKDYNRKLGGSVL
jgi:uroporphyrinogen decarboxylase